MNRRQIKKNRIAFKIWTAVPRVEKYKFGAAGQILETIRFISFRYDSFTGGHSNTYTTIHLRAVSHQYPWLVTGVYAALLIDEKFII